MINCDMKVEGNKIKNIEGMDGSLLNDKHSKSRFKIYKENRLKK